MDSFLQILGSIASIGSIPLAIYLYLRSREAKFARLKLGIVKVLSYQIGEGRELALFEIKSVIDSKVREDGLKLNSISVDDILEDLVTETISNPLLDKERKKEIVVNLFHLHSSSVKLSDFDEPNTEQKIVNISEPTKHAEKEEKIGIKQTIITKRLSEYFAVIASITTLTVFLSSTFIDKVFQNELEQFLKENQEALFLALSIFVSVATSILTFFAYKYSKRKK